MFTQPPLASTVSTTTPKNWLRSSTTSVAGRLDGELGGAGHVDEEDRDRPGLPAEALLPLERLPRDVLADVAAEEVADALALAQAGDHLVEAALQQAELAAVVDGHLDVEVALGDVGDGMAHRDDRIGRDPGGDEGR